MEKAISEALGKSDNVIKDDKALTPAEEKFLQAMNVEEARERHRQLQKMRALMSYQEAKLKRKAKIKSKKYHRLLKKEKIRKEMKEFETLKETDPDKAMEKLNQLDKMRALERASLKHMNTGKWSKHNKLRAKYDRSAREAIANQLETSKKLMTKTQSNLDDNQDEVIVSDGEPDEAAEEGVEMMGADESGVNTDFQDNPWLGRHSQGLSLTAPVIYEEINRIESNVDDKSPQKETAPEKLGKKIKQPKTTIITAVTDISTSKAKEPENEKEITENRKTVKNTSKKRERIESKKSENSKVGGNNKGDNLSIDPKKILEVESKRIGKSFPRLQERPNESNDEEDDDDDEDERRKLIAEAFAEDDVINEFAKEKKEIEEREGEKDVTKFLPGWGHWSGPGIKESKKIRKRFTQKAQKKPRRDRNLGNVIISEKNSDAISKLTVSKYIFKKILNPNCKYYFR